MSDMYISSDTDTPTHAHLRDASVHIPLATGNERPIGDLIREAHDLSADQVEAVLKHQREHGVRFGEAAIALGFVEGKDVLWALSQQFHYPYADSHQAPLHPELVVANAPFSPQAEVFRTMRSQLTMRLHGEARTHRAIAMISPDHGDGKSYFAANLAIAFSQLGGRTLLVDADLRSPRQHELFGLGNDTGLSNMLSGRTTERIVHPVPGLPSLYVLPVGATPPNPQELLESAAFERLLVELSGKFDHVLVDTPAASEGADAYVIATRCGATLAIARKGRSRMEALHSMVNVMRTNQIRVLGALLNEH